MNYSILIYETEADFAERSDPAKREARFGAWMAYFHTLRAAGILVAELLRKPLLVRYCGDWTNPKTKPEHLWRWYVSGDPNLSRPG